MASSYKSHKHPPALLGPCLSVTLCDNALPAHTAHRSPHIAKASCPEPLLSFPLLPALCPVDLPRHTLRVVLWILVRAVRLPSSSYAACKACTSHQASKSNSEAVKDRLLTSQKNLVLHCGQLFSVWDHFSTCSRQEKACHATTTPDMSRDTVSASRVPETCKPLICEPDACVMKKMCAVVNGSNLGQLFQAWIPAGSSAATIAVLLCGISARVRNYFRN